MAKGKLPFYWGNKIWGQRKSGKIYSKDRLDKGNPKWIDYRALPNSSTDFLVSDEYEFKSFRLELHQQIINKIILDSGAETEEKPICLITSGGTASGKTSAMDVFVEEVLAEQEEKYVRIDFDRIKRALPEYEHMVEEGIRDAAPYTQGESAKISGKLFKRAIKLSANIIYETTLTSHLNVEERINDMRKKGYFIYIIGTHLKEPEGQRRAMKRYQEGGRYVPPEAISETYSKCPTSLKTLSSKVDMVMLFDNNETIHRPMLFRDNTSGDVKVLNEEAYREYLLDVGNANDLRG